MKPYHISLLGPPEILWNDSPLLIPRKQTRALLYYLINQEQRVSRDYLAELFWQNIPFSRQNLRYILGKLRQALPDPTLIHVYEDQLEANLNLAAVDVLDYEKIQQHLGEQPWNIPEVDLLPHWIVSEMYAAIHLWHGRTFLEGFALPKGLGFDIWLENIRQHLERTHHRLLERLADHEIATGNLDQALELLIKALDNQYYEEYLHERILKILIRLNRTKEAHDHYKSYRTRLKKELGLQPGTEIQSLYPKFSRDAQTVSTQAPLHWTLRSTAHVPFIGREKYLIELHQRYLKAGLSFLLGESGIGKTRLMQEMVSRLEPVPRVLLAQCRATEKNLPLHPLLETLKQSVTHLEWQQMPAVWASHLLPLLPNLAEIRPALTPPQTSPDQANLLRYQALQILFNNLARRQRLILVIDDAHWSDEATLTAIAYLAQREPFRQNAYLLISARTDEINPALDELIRCFGGRDSPATIHLTRMTLLEIQDLLGHLQKTNFSSNFIEKISRITGGNPLYLIESLREVSPEMLLEIEKGTRHMPRSPKISAVIQNRIKALSPAARQVLAVAAIADPYSSSVVIAQVSQLHPEQLSRAFQELTQRTLIEPVAQHGDDVRYYFCHDQIREAQLELLHVVEKRDLHHQVAQALEMEWGAASTDRAAILANHYQSAGKWNVAFNYWIQAGQHARRLLSAQEANQAFTQAQMLLDLMGKTITTKDILALYEEWGEMAYALNDTDTLQKMGNQLSLLASRQNNRTLRALAFLLLGQAGMTSGQIREGLEYCQEAIASLQDTDHPSMFIRVHTLHGVLLYMSGNIQEAIQSLETGLEIAERSMDPRLAGKRGQILHELGFCYLLNGRLQQGYQCALLSLAEFEPINFLDGIGTAHSLAALAANFMGEYSKASDHCRLGIQLSQDFQSWRHTGYFHAYQALTSLALGDLAQAIHHAYKAIETGEVMQRKEINSTGLRIIGDIFSWLQDYPKAADYYTKAVNIHTESFLAMDQAIRLHLMLNLLTQEKHHRNSLELISAQADVAGLFTGKILADQALLVAYFFGQEWAVFNELENILSDRTQTLGFLPLKLQINLLKAHALLQKDELTTAFELLNQIADKAQEIGNYWLTVESLIGLIQTARKLDRDASPYQIRLKQYLNPMSWSDLPAEFNEAVTKYQNHIQNNL